MFVKDVSLQYDASVLNSYPYSAFIVLSNGALEFKFVVVIALAVSKLMMVVCTD